MKRRTFITKTVAGASLPFWLQGCNPFSSQRRLPITVHSDHATGHLIMESRSWARTKNLSTETVIVGGGIAGLAAAYGIKERPFLLFEMSDRMGGSSAAQSHDRLSFSQGAHYDLAYPAYYGEEVLALLEQLGIIEYQPWRDNWTFSDSRHIVPHYRKQQCFEKGKKRPDVIRKGFHRQRFFEIISAYQGKMKLPTRLIEEPYRELDQVDLYTYLSQNMEVGPEFKRQLSYHMLDDYGGTADQVSALAGIHYFMCRPYYSEPVDLFSPPNGNDYFVEKLQAALPLDRVKQRHLVQRVSSRGQGFMVEVLDTINKEVVEVNCDRVIYAGQKHALKYVYPEEASLFNNQYAPWMVVNIVSNEEGRNYGFWQNEYLGDREDFLGFIDSSVQHQTNSEYRIFSAYYCLKPENREYLTTVADHKDRIVQETIGLIEEVLNKKIRVEAAYINVMGHAMPIPQPNYLFKDANHSAKGGVVYAGVDNGRLPLLFEALDSGLEAAQLTLS